jgi:hypothetical protein
MLIVEPEGKIWLLRGRWQDNIKTILKEIGFEDRNCIKLAQTSIQ